MSVAVVPFCFHPEVTANVTEASLSVALNAVAYIFLTLDGIVIAVSLLQFENVDFSIVVILLGIVTEEKLQ